MTVCGSGDYNEWCIYLSIQIFNATRQLSHIDAVPMVHTIFDLCIYLLTREVPITTAAVEKMSMSCAAAVICILRINCTLRINEFTVS